MSWWAATTGHIFSYEVQSIFWLSIAFILTYSLLAKWWRHPFGWALVTLDGALALAVFPSLLARYFGLHLVSAEWVAWLDVFCFAVVPLVILSRLFLVIKVNRAKGKSIWEVLKGALTEFASEPVTWVGTHYLEQ